MSFFAKRSCAACPCPCPFVPTFTTSIVSNSVVPSVADVTITITNSPPTQTQLGTPTYTNPLLGYSGVSQVVQTDVATWVISNVPWGGDMRVGLSALSLTSTCPDQFVTITIPVPPYAMRSTGINISTLTPQAWLVSGSAKTTCLTFGWIVLSPSSSNVNSFLYTVTDSSNVVVAVNVLPAGTETVLVDNLLPGSTYTFKIQGLVENGRLSTAATTAVTVTATTPQPTLGTSFTFSSSRVYDEIDDTWTSTISYDDYTCIGSIVSVSNGGGTGVVTRIGSTLPLLFTVSGVPSGSTLYVALTALADPACTCGCVCVGSSGLNLTGTLAITAPNTPADSCEDVTAVTNLAQSANGATCVTASWTPSPLCTFGYICTLTDSDYATPLQTQTLHDPSADSVTFGGLPASFTTTTYGVIVAVLCDAEGAQGASAQALMDTAAACTPNLGYVASTVVTPDSNGTYTATVTLEGYQCTTPQLIWTAGSNVPSMAVIRNTPTLLSEWTVSNLPGLPLPGVYNMAFIGFPIDESPSSCTSSCCTSIYTIPTPVLFTIVTPASASPCAANISVSCGSSTSTSLTFNLSWPLVTQPTGPYEYYVSPTVPGGGTSTVPIPLLNTVTSVTVTGLTANVSYTFYVRPKCGVNWSSCSCTTAASPSPAALAAFVQTSTNPVFTYNATTGTYTATLTYPNSNITGYVTNIRLVSEGSPSPPLTISTQGLTFVITPMTAGATYDFHMLGNVAVVSSGFPIIVPSTPPVPDDLLFELLIPHYAGPPSVIRDCCADVEGDAPGDIYATIDAPVSAKSSYLNLCSLCNSYATTIVEGFVKHRMQTISNVLGYALHTPISRIYFGNTQDPTYQGAEVPFIPPEKTYYQAKYTYNTAISSYPSGSSSFKVPAFLAFYKQMMIYNWEMVNGKYANNAPVQLGATMFGSQGYPWWFNVVVDSTTGVISTIAPSNPMLLPSIIDGLTNDGNGDGSTYAFAGWNCMERWFMHIAYCNQVLREMIASSEIVSLITGVPAMTLNDLTQEHAKFFQISCLTFDGEQNSFPNTLYPDANSTKYPQNWLSWFQDVSSAMCNADIALLWNKWINQATVPNGAVNPPLLPDGTSNVTLKRPDWTTAYYAPAGRSTMPLASTPFTLKPAMSMTTPGLIKDMNVSDLGTDDFSSVDLIFNEIYDTSDSQPTYFLGATSTPSSNITALFSGVSGGARFTSVVQTAAMDTPAYQATPETYSANFGTWDNVPAGQNKQLQTTNITYIDDSGNLQTGVQTVTNSNGTTTLVGAATVYNTGLSGTGVNNQYCALMNTSKFNPWAPSANGANGTVPWILSYNGPVVADTVNYKDYYALAWALEGSRYDLYNGAWAAEVSSIIDYSTVQQGQNTADGSLLWSDLSTGLKPRVAARLLGIQRKSVSIKQTTNAMAGNVWMLSCQAGPYVNAMGVCASKRSGTGGGDIELPDLLTFTYPGSDWPGWPGMKGQWWGIGSANNANVNVKAILDQQKWGVYDTYNPPSTILATGSSEDNFGVFSDFNIQFAAWVQMALDAQGIPSMDGKRGAASSAGITSTMSVKYSTAVDGTGLPKLGCYELGFLPMSWFSSPSSIPSTVSFP